MMNEEISKSYFNIQVRLAKATGREILKQILKLYEKMNKEGLSNIVNTSSKIKLKDMVKKGQLEEIDLKDSEYKELKKILNRNGVNFSVTKDRKTNTYSVFFQAKDIKVMEYAFKKAVKISEKKTDRKESIRKSIDKLKEQIKNTISKDKIKNKNKEQSL